MKDTEKVKKKKIAAAKRDPVSAAVVVETSEKRPPTPCSFCHFAAGRESRLMTCIRAAAAGSASVKGPGV